MSFRAFLAILLSIIVLLIWMMYIQKTEPLEQPAPVIEQPVKPQEPVAKQLLLPTQPEEVIEVDIKSARFKLTSRGALIKSIILPEYQRQGVKTNVPVELVENYAQTEINRFPLGITLLISDLLNDELNNANYKVIKTTETNIGFVWTTDGRGKLPKGIEITKTYNFFYNKYLFELSIELKNLSKEIVKLDEILLNWEPYLGPVNKKDDYNIISLHYFHQGKLNKINFQPGFLACLRPTENIPSTKKFKQQVDWLAICNRYFLSAIIPKEGYKVSSANFFHDGFENYTMSIGLTADKVLMPNSAIKYSYFVYTGPKQQRIFREYDLLFRGRNLWQLEKTIGFTKFITPLGNFFLQVLIFLYRIVKNYGTAIVIFSLLARIVFWPLNVIQFRSMLKMQKLQPLLAELRNRYKDNPQKLNQEMMLLYRKYKVNPAGGCLPLLVQIPIFIAIYDMLQKSFELRNAPFILWIKDLSCPDTIFTIGDFSINVLPLLMTITMIIQQKLTPGFTAPQQKLMTYVLPIILLFIFWNMPAGLVLYWTLQNILSILQQLYTLNIKRLKTQ